jgi:hypothetical protein
VVAADSMLKVGLLFGFAMALKEHSDAAIGRLQKAAAREEVNLSGLAKFRRTRGRKSALFVLR